MARFPHCFFLPSFISSLPGPEPGQNPGCLASGANEAQAMMFYFKASVRDTATSKRWICQREAHSAGCVSLQRASAEAMEYGVASFCELDEFIC